MRTDIYLQPRQQSRSPLVATHEKAFAILAATVFLVGSLCAGAFLLFDFTLPSLGHVWRTKSPYTRQELVEACALFGVIGAVLFCGWARAKRPRDLVAIAVIAAIIMPAFALGYSQVSNAWRLLFRAMLGW